MNNCPCNKCICMPICRLKQYPKLVNCKLVWSYLKNPFNWIGMPERENGKLKLVHKYLEPTRWTLFYDEYERVMVDNDCGYHDCHFHY